MIDLTTRYLGLDLRSPIVASASPLNARRSTPSARIEDAGAAAIVLPSLFEEEILHEEIELNRALEAGSEHFAEALDYFPAVDDFADAGDRYLADLDALKAASRVPIIASLNATSHRRLGPLRQRSSSEAGADAIELNVARVHTPGKPVGDGAVAARASNQIAPSAACPVLRTPPGSPGPCSRHPHRSALPSFASIAGAQSVAVVSTSRCELPKTVESCWTGCSGSTARVGGLAPFPV